ncbi:MAG: DUF5060 domain-containing protein [Opitutales bacterium]|nr:DUF5060 domain-containing protein [Opitutales bacterium]
MKAFSIFLLAVAAGVFVPSAAVASLTAPSEVEQWDLIELTLEGPSEGNPFLEVRISATFSDGFQSKVVDGFYDGDGVYRIRFMPDRTGTWTYVTHSNRSRLTNRQGRFTVTPAGEGNHGPVGVYQTFHFAYADGTPYFPVGTTAYNWLHRNDRLRTETIDTLAQSPFNKVRMLLYPEDEKGRPLPPEFPFEGTDPRAREWDFERFNPAFFRRIEEGILALRDLGIEADVILFHKYGEDWGFESMDVETDDRYLKYVVARLAAFRNVWWSVANEWDFVRTKTMADWDRYFEILRDKDPYGRLRSIHNGFRMYDHNKDWVTHVSIQNGAAVEESGRAQMYRDVYEKPVVYDEVKYEGDLVQRWGNLSAEEMVHRFWAGTVAGTYVGHGECYQHPTREIWLTTGGVLRGESPSRIAFLRDILESVPGRVNPIDKWQDPTAGGVHGEHYLVYFGREAPAEWPFRLFRRGVAEGQEYAVEIIDTWNMTITPVEGTFVVTREDGYHFVDREGRSVELPGKPYHALRIRRVGGDSVFAAEELPLL